LGVFEGMRVRGSVKSKGARGQGRQERQGRQEVQERQGRQAGGGKSGKRESAYVVERGKSERKSESERGCDDVRECV
jgi:hypothetical protein